MFAKEKSWEELKREWIERDGAFSPRLGARTMRQLAFMAWCPACQDGDHFNHREADGSCHTMETLREVRCKCIVRTSAYLPAPSSRRRSSRA